MTPNFIHSKQSAWLCLLVLATVSFAAVLPILINGIPFGYDLPHHYQCAITFVESIKSGDFYPSWSPFRNFGYGGMEPRLYPPISHYTLAVFYLATSDWHLATWLTVFFFTLVGAVGVYLWAREYVEPWHAVFAGCVFAFLPYHLNQIYNTFFFAEYAGTAVLPFTFVFVSRVCRRGKFSDVVGLGVSFAAIVLTHLPLTVIGSFCFAIYGLTLLRREKTFDQILRLGGGIVLGLAGSAFFWVKVVQERDLLAKFSVYADPWLDYNLHFLATPFQTIEQGVHTEIYETATMYYDLMFLCGVVLVSAFCLPFLRTSFANFRRFAGVIAVFLSACFLIIPASRPIWDRVSVLQEVQFPWRWVAIVCVTAPVIASGGVKNLILWFKSDKRPWALIIIGCLFAVITFSISQIIRPAPFIAKSEIASKMEKVSGDIGFTFWWPVWTRKEIFDVKEKVTSESRTAEIQKWDATEKLFTVAAGESKDARVAIFYHPNWKAYVNDQPAATHPDENGALIVAVPPTSSTVRVSFEETSFTNAAGLLSVAVWVPLGLILLLYFRRRFLALLINGSQPKGSNFPVRIVTAIGSFIRTRNGIYILLAATFLTITPMIFIGVFNGGDLQQHAQWAETYRSAIESGNFLPSWAGDENNGYGGLGVRFYPPIFHLLWAFLRVGAGDWHTATWITFLLFSAVGSLGIYFWAKEFIAKEFAVVAGLIFLIMPYHVIEIYNAAMYAEFAGCSVITFSFYFATRVCRNGKIADILGLAISIAALALTHLPTTVIGTPALILYSLFLLKREKIAPTLVKLAVAAATGLAASSFYWIKVVTELQWMRSTRFWKDDHFDFHRNFLITSAWFDTRNLYFFNLIYILLLLIGIVGTIYLFRRIGFERKSGMTAIIAVFFLAMIMCSVLSQPVWEIVPFLDRVQFPWRWMTIASVSGAVITGFILESIIKNSWIQTFAMARNKLVAGFGVLMFGAIFTIVLIEFQRTWIPSANVENEIVTQSKRIGFEEYWTTPSKSNVFDQKERVIANERVVTVDSWKWNNRSFQIEPGPAEYARVATLYYPHWRAIVNGNSVPVEMDEAGAIIIPIPPGRSSVQLSFEEPRCVHITSVISIISFMGMATALLLLAMFRFQTFRRRDLFASTE